MSKVTQVRFQKLLSGKRSEFNERLEQITKSLRQELKCTPKLKGSEADVEEDNSQEVYILNKRMAFFREMILKCDDAEERVKDGFYGICEACGEGISLKKLKVSPFATLCQWCQKMTE